MSGDFDTENPQVNQDLANANAAHLAYLERWSGEMPAVVRGVNILQCLGYDLVQLLNQRFLAGYIAAHQKAAQAAAVETPASHEEVTRKVAPAAAVEAPSPDSEKGPSHV